MNIANTSLYLTKNSKSRIWRLLTENAMREKWGWKKRQRPHWASSAAGNTTCARNKGITIQQQTKRITASYLELQKTENRHNPGFQNCQRNRLSQPALQVFSGHQSWCSKESLVPQEGPVINFKPRVQQAIDTTFSRPEWLKCGTLCQTSQFRLGQ